METQDLAHAKRIVAAYQGAPGAFSEQAIRQLWGDAADPLPCAEFAAVAAAVTAGVARYAVLPVHNTIAGPVEASLAVVQACPELVAVGGTEVHVQIALLGLPGASVADVREAISHPVALAQCGRFLAEHPQITPRAVFDTGGAARQVADAGRPELAAFASVLAGERYGLQVLATGVQDRSDNWTRFVVYALAGFP